MSHPPPRIQFAAHRHPMYSYILTTHPSHHAHSQLQSEDLRTVGAALRHARAPGAEGRPMVSGWPAARNLPGSAVPPESGRVPRAPEQHEARLLCTVAARAAARTEGRPLSDLENGARLQDQGVCSSFNFQL